MRFVSEVSKTNLIGIRSALQSLLCVAVGLAVFRFSESRELREIQAQNQKVVPFMNIPLFPEAGAHRTSGNGHVL